MFKKSEISIKHGESCTNLKFGMTSTAVFCELEGVSIAGIAPRLLDPMPMTPIHFLMSGIIAHNRHNKIKDEVTPEQVADIIDEIGVIKVFEMVNECFATYESDNAEKKKIDEETKNVQAPIS